MTTTSDNDAAPTPNHSLIASLLPTIRPPAALLEPDGHTKRTTAQAVIGKVMSLCMMAGIIGSIYAFGELTVGTDCLNKLSFAPGTHNAAGRMGVSQSTRPWAPGAPFGHPGGEP